MKSKDLRSLLQKLNNHIIRNMDTATGIGIKRGHYEITMEHLLNALIEDGQGDVPLILRQYSVDSGRVQETCLKNLEEMKTGNPGKPKLSPLLTDLFEQAWITSSVHHKETKIRSGALFEVFIASELVISTGLMELLSPINQEQLRADFYKIVTGSVEDDAAAMEALPADEAKEIPKGGTVLDIYTTNLTVQAKEGKIDPILGRDSEIIQMIEVLSRRKKSNPILLGEPGVGKTAVVEGFANKVAADQVPDILKGVQIHALDLGALQAGTKMRGEFEKRLKAVINEVTKSSHQIILFIDEAHTLIGAGASAGGSDAANLLKPALARGEFRAVAATTYLEYNKYFAKDAALERRFQPIHIGEPEDDQAMLMLRGIKEKYETYHGIHISDGAIEAAVKLSRKYIAGRQLPDKAVDLLDTSATRVKMSLTSKPPSLELTISKLGSVKLEMETLQMDHDLKIEDHSEELKALAKEKEKLEKDIAAKEERWTKECELIKELMELRKAKFAQDPTAKLDPKIDKDITAVTKKISDLQGEDAQVFADVTALTVAEIIESWTGIPVGNMTQDEMTTVLKLGDELRKRVVGQDHVIAQVVDVIRGSKIGLKREEAPIGVFLFIGPSGVGKTELARAVAEALFGDERFMVTLNMTEYQNEYNTSRLIGADPGLIGYGEGGALSEPVRRRPYSVVLLDEIEKANQSVMDLFMQVFDRGMLQDADRRQINFNNTIIFMTSNLASEVIFANYNEGMTDPDALLEEMRPYMNQHFRPEFLGRLKPIVFLPLAEDVMKLIVELKLGRLARRLQENQNLKVEFTKTIVKEIVSRCTRAETGARNIDAIIDRNITPEISTQLLGFMTEGKEPSLLKIGKDKKGNFTYNFT
ncbi:MAG: type VI secretion system ATPase TssH [Candidatus Aminicenantaceae bacterium]